MHVYETERDPTFGAKQRQSQLSERFLMRRRLSLLALALTVALAGACANPAGPARDDDDSPPDSTDDSFCGVVAGTQTRCGPR